MVSSMRRCPDFKEAVHRPLAASCGRRERFYRRACAALDYLESAASIDLERSEEQALDTSKSAYFSAEPPTARQGSRLG